VEVVFVRAVKLLLLLCIVGVFVWGCVEELNPGQNMKPMIWFTRGPDQDEQIYNNSVDFEWMASDWDDDLGMGATFVRLEPSTVPWVNEQDETVYFEHPEGWVREYTNTYQVLDLPDTDFVFSVRVIDGRGADSIATRNFVVRFDNIPPDIDSVIAPRFKPPAKIFTHTYKIFASDRARTPRAATPPEEIEYWYRLVGPSGFDAIESTPEYSVGNNEVTVNINGVQFPGEYTFRCKARDNAGNTSAEVKRQFVIEE
jgi:hypothetical protein